MEQVKGHYAEAAEEAERSLAEMRRITAAKDQYMARDRAEILALKEKVEILEARHLLELTTTTEEAKESATLAVFQSKVKMAEEASDPNFDRSNWKVEEWKKVVSELSFEDPGAANRARMLVAVERSRMRMRRHWWL